MVTQFAKQIYTLAEYLELEKEAELRHEFINGDMIPNIG